MKRFRTALALTLTFIAAGVLYLQTTPAARAAASERISQAIYNDLQNAQELADGEDVDGA